MNRSKRLELGQTVGTAIACVLSGIVLAALLVVFALLVRLLGVLL